MLQKLAALLYLAADECRYVNPDNVENILGVSKQQAASSSKEGHEKEVPGTLPYFTLAVALNYETLAVALNYEKNEIVCRNVALISFS